MIDLAAIRHAIDPKAPASGDVRCPVHEDSHPSMSVSLGERGNLLCRCHAGCEQSAVFAEVRKRAGHLLNGAARDFGGQEPRKTMYEYTDAAGKAIARVHRTDKPDGSKDFKQQTPDGAGGWQWKGPKGPTPLYRLQALAAAPALPVVICEGEKACGAAQRLLGDGYVATCWMGGVGQVERADLGPLKGREVILWPDADPPGQKAAAAILARLGGIAARVRTVRVDDLPAKADAADVQWTPAEFKRRLLEPGAGEQAPPYKLLSVSEVLALPPTPWLVNDLLPARGLAVLYGEPGSGKSFLALDVAVHLARKKRWSNRRVRHAKVVYIVLEGSLRNRLDAYKKHHGLIDADLVGLLTIQNEPLNLLDKATVPALVASIKQTLNGYTGELVVVIDTLARAMPGGNENASEDMGALIAACGEVERHLKALVLLVHHAGKDATRGARGWSGLRGAADAEILCERSGDNRRATFCKVKDGADGVAVEFRLEVVDLGPRSAVDPEAGDLERVTSCVAVITDTDAKPRQPDKALGKNQKALLTALHNSGPWMRKQCDEFMQSVGIPRNRRKEVIDSLLLASVIEDTIAGLRVKA